MEFYGVCSRCKRMLRQGVKFCPACGQPAVVETQIGSSPAADVARQQAFLEEYRRALALYVRHQAITPPGLCPPGVAEGAAESRSAIVYLKSCLRALGAVVEDRVGDPPDGGATGVDAAQSRGDAPYDPLHFGWVYAGETLNVYADAVAALGSVDVTTLPPPDVFVRTRHGVIEKRSLHGRPVIVKKTKGDMCQAGTLTRLVGRVVVGYERGVSALVATPLAVWREGEYVCEVHPLYEGVSLYDFVGASVYRFRGDYLGAVHNALFDAVGQLHALGVVHRDINPFNVLITPFGNVIVLDISFCCDVHAAQFPIGNSSYSALEQRAGQASQVSDWYALAATLYFAANGFAPVREEGHRFAYGVQTMMQTGTYRLGAHVGHVFIDQGGLYDALLSFDVHKRPVDVHAILLCPATNPIMLTPVVGIFRLGYLRYLVLMEYDFRVVSHDELGVFLRVAQQQHAITSEGLARDVALFLGGESPWGTF